MKTGRLDMFFLRESTLVRFRNKSTLPGEFLLWEGTLIFKSVSLLPCNQLYFLYKRSRYTGWSFKIHRVIVFWINWIKVEVCEEMKSRDGKQTRVSLEKRFHISDCYENHHES